MDDTTIESANGMEKSNPTFATEEIPHKHIKPTVIFIGVILVLILSIYFLGDIYIKNFHPANTQSKLMTDEKPKLFNPQVQMNLPRNWQTYENNKLTVSVKYPNHLFVNEFPTGVIFFFEKYNGKNTTPTEHIGIYKRDEEYKKEFETLYNAEPRDSVTGVHDVNAVSVTKLRNLLFGAYNAVEFIGDGITPQNTLQNNTINATYSHMILIKRNDNEYIELVNSSPSIEATHTHDEIFNTMLSSITF